ncbi:shikimate kinase [Tamilnaduibacter salinus]|nr:shikimate kinase [Tamilnaduibacter salinus]PAV26845.1 shikimate kinase [Tamilnaduibacter salinus]
MMGDRSNIILIGMPGSGKSTIGVLLAKAAGMDFVDTDLLIQSDQGQTLQTIVDERGYLALREVEERVLCRIPRAGQVIATGGSAVYGETAMAHLKSTGPVVFLNIPLATVRERIGDYSLRGLSKRPDQSLEALFDERLALYQRYADLTVDGEGRTQERICDMILASIPN